MDIETLNKIFGPLEFVPFPTEGDKADEYAFNVGDVIRTKDGGHYLVGDVNECLGVCDDCKDFSIWDIEAVAKLQQREA